MSHHLFILSPSDTPLYSLTHYSTKPAPNVSSPLSANLPTWSTSAFAGTLTALSGASSATHHTSGGGIRMGGGQDRHVIQMIANASLDVIEEMMRKDNAMYLKSVDRFNEWTVSGFITPGNTKFVLLHDGRNEEGIRQFFGEVWEVYVKAAVNPFQTGQRAIRSSVFDARVRASARKHLAGVTLSSPSSLSLSFFMSSTHNSRASLLAGLRTGGVRSAVQPSFSLPRYPSQSQPLYQDDDFVDSIPIPLTAAVDGSNNRYALQQPSSGLNPNSAPFSPTLFSQNAMQQNQFQNQQAIQRQLLQLEMMRIQAVQAQQIQAELLAQAQRQQQQQHQQAQAQAQAQARERRTSLGFTNAPATAGPHITAFDLRSATLSAQMRRANQAEQLRAQLGLTPPAEDQVPMTAALGGRFGGRTANASPHLSRFIPEEPEEYTAQMPPTPGSTTIGAGTSFGNPTSNHVNVMSNAPPSRSDQVSNWRRPGNNNVGLSHRAVSSPTVKITPPPSERQRISPPPGITVTSPTAKGRPQPLNIFPVTSLPLATVAIDTTDSTEDDEASSVRSSSISSPTTPRSSSSSTNHESQLSPREEATKKLYEGLGIDRPVPTVGTGQPQHFHNFPLSHAHPHSAQVVQNHRMASQPTRQPRGPPSGADELGPKNFATRIRRQAIGGLGMLMGARERRESYVEVY